MRRPVQDRSCSACGHPLVWYSGDTDRPREVCDRCGHCVDRRSGDIIDSVACSGCIRRPVCESRPTDATVAATRWVESKDGTPIGIRVLVPGDRDVLSESYDELSERSRRLRFFSPPKRLSPALLTYLTMLDYHDRFALVAFVAATQEGIGLARWSRDRTDPERAEAAVVVTDPWQGRGVGTQLLTSLVAEASTRGIEVFTAEVLWENERILGPARSLGARCTALEPGVAEVAFDLASSTENTLDGALGQFFRDVAAT